MSPRSDGVNAAKVYLTEGHLTIGVIPNNKMPVWARSDPGGCIRKHSPERGDSTGKEEDVVLDQQQVSWRTRDEQATAHLRLLLLRKKRNKLLQRPFQMFLRYDAFRISTQAIGSLGWG